MRIKNLFYLFIITLFSSCYPTPQFPDVPSIELENYYFIENSQLDSLVISIAFKDGDGDLGLTTADIGYPFHQFNLYSRVDGQEIHEKAYGKKTSYLTYLDEAIRYTDKRTGEIDSLPFYVAPYSCTRWKTNLVIDENSSVEDTVYYQRNPYYYNFYIQFFTKETINDEFEELNFDFIGNNCGSNYHGRFPYLLEENEEKSVEGVITYHVTGSQLSTILERRFLKLRIYIYDRSLNKSNVIETPEFILSEITI